MLGEHKAGPQVIVLDEYPYLRNSSPELDSTVQALIDEATAGDLGDRWTSPVTIIVCGSAMSVMNRHLERHVTYAGPGGAGPAAGCLRLPSSPRVLGYRQPAAAFAVDSIVGGTAGYKDLTATVAPPSSPEDLGRWLATTVLNPSHALFREDEYLLREDPRITAEAPYYSLLQAIAAGRTSQGQIAAAVGRAPSDIVHHLKVMTTAGFLVRDHDLLTTRRPKYRIADPIVRFHHLVTRRHMVLLEDRRADEAWSRSAATYQSNVVGPHFEWICRRWVNRYASLATLGGPAGPAHRLQINDRDRRRSFELDIAAAALQSVEDGGHDRRVVIQAIGEAKATRLDTADLGRLDHISDLIAGHKRISPASNIKLLLFSLKGFTRDLSAAARRRADVELIDLERLHRGD